MTFQLDTTGDVGPMPAGPMNERFLKWSDLSPFTQGYVEALFGAHFITRLAFDMLAPETLARIIADCEARSARLLSVYCDKRGGHEFWEARQIGEAPSDFPPLTVQLGDDGKVRFA